MNILKIKLIKIRRNKELLNWKNKMNEKMNFEIIIFKIDNL